MNLNHEVDMRRPFAAEYMEARKDVRFWDNLKAPTQQAIAMYFEDATLRPATIEQAVGMSQSTLRRVLSTRGMWAPTSVQVALAERRVETNKYKGPNGGGPKLVRCVPGTEPQVVKASTRACGNPLSGAIQALEGQMSDISTQMRQLSTEWDKLNAALSTLKGL